MPFIPLNKRQHPDFASNKKPVGQVELEKPQIFHTLLRDSTRDDVSGITPAFGGDSSLTAPEGLRIRGGTATSSDGYVDYALGDFLPTDGYTIFCKVKFVSAPATTSGQDIIAEKPYTSASEPFYAFQLKRQRTSQNVDFQYQFTIGGTRRVVNVGDGTNLSAGVTATFALGVSNGKQYHHLITDTGVYLSGTTSYTGTPDDYNTDLRLGASKLFSTQGSLPKNIEYFRISPYVSEAEAQTFLRDPYQVLKPSVDLMGFWSAGAPPAANDIPVFLQHFRNQGQV